MCSVVLTTFILNLRLPKNENFKGKIKNRMVMFPNTHNKGLFFHFLCPVDFYFKLLPNVK